MIIHVDVDEGDADVHEDVNGEVRFCFRESLIESVHKSNNKDDTCSENVCKRPESKK